MSHNTDQYLSEKVKGLAEAIPIRVESELRRFRARAASPSRPTWIAVVAVCSVVLAALTGGYAVGQRVAIANGRASESSSDQEFVQRWGGQILWADESEGRLVRTSTKEVSPLESELDGQASVLSPMGEVISFVGGDLYVVEPNQSKREVYKGEPVVSVSWSPSPNVFAFETCQPPGSTVCTLRLGERFATQRTLAASSGRGHDWSADGESITYVDGQNRLAITGLGGADGRIVASPGEVQGASFFLAPTWSPDGAHIAVIAEGADGFTPMIFTTQGKVVARGTASLLAPPKLAWSEAGEELFIAEGPVEAYEPGMTSSLWRLAAPDWTPELMLTTPGELVRGIFVSPSGGALLFQTANAEALQENAGVGPVESVWYLIDREDRRLLDRSSGAGQILSWVLENTD